MEIKREKEASYPQPMEANRTITVHLVCFACAEVKLQSSENKGKERALLYREKKKSGGRGVQRPNFGTGRPQKVFRFLNFKKTD